MAVTNAIGCAKETGIVSKRDTALANSASLVITHGKDSLNARSVSIWVSGVLTPPAAASGVKVENTSDTTTTITNQTGGSVDIQVSISVAVNGGALA